MSGASTIWGGGRLRQVREIWAAAFVRSRGDERREE
jgi:hypothetical protein